MRAAVAAALAVGCLLLLLAGPLAAQEGRESIRGTLLDAEGEPVEGAEITVDAGGRETDTATTAEDGTWSIELPGPGEYAATLDTDSLPEDVGLTDPDRQTLEFSIRTGESRTLIFRLGEREEQTSQLLRRAAQSALNGVTFGLIIAMTAIGLSLIFGTTGLINFAHGELVTFGAVVAFAFNAVWPGVHIVAAGLLAVLAGAALGGTLESGLWRPLRRRKTGLIQMLVVTVGLAFLLRHLIQFFLGGGRRPYLQYALQQSIELGPVRTTPRDLFVIGLSLLVLVAVGLLLTRTRLGKAMRAVADNRDLAESSGIDVERIVLIVWILGGGLAAVGGVFLGLVESVSYLMGFRLLLLMFAGVILGGLGTAYGALVGSILIGLVTELSTLRFSPEVKYMWALLVLALVLLVRPQGLLGTRERVG